MQSADDIIYVSDPHSYDLYYLNPAGQTADGLPQTSGERNATRCCRDAIEPCTFCNNQYLNTDEFTVWERENEYCKRHFLLKDKLIEFQGRQARLEIAMDITKNEIVSREVQERLTFVTKDRRLYPDMLPEDGGL